MQLSKLNIKIGLLFLIGLLALQSYLFFQYINKIHNSKEWQIHTLKIITELESLYSNLSDAENGQANYILFANREYLKPYQAVISQIPGKNDNLIAINLRDIYNFTIDNPKQTAALNRLQILVNQHLDFLKQSIDYYTKNGTTSTLEKLRSLPVSPLKSELRKQVSAMILEEERLLEIRAAAGQKAENSLLAFILVAALLTYFLLSGTVYLLLKARQRLSINEERLNLAVQGTSDGLWDWDLNQHKTYYSHRLQEILGYVNGEMTNTIEGFTSRIHPNDRKLFDAAVDAHFQSQVPFNVECRLLKKDEALIWIQARGQATWDPKGYPIRMSGFITDITQRKDIERLKNEFVSTVSHELRTPLTSIRGSLGLLQTGVGGAIPEKASGLIDIAYKNCDRLIMLINDMLDIEKIASGKMHFEFDLVDIKTIIYQALELNRDYAEKYKVKFILQEPISDNIVNVDSNRLIQVLSNLMSNAAKFSPENKAVEISTITNDKNVRVLIKDYGPGIPEAFRKRIFEKFSQADSSNTKQTSGTGLGLNISKAIIEKFNGKIGYVSQVGKGTTFYFELPYLPLPEVSYIPEVRQDKPRILVCEDDIDQAHILKNILEEKGFCVDIAYTAQQAKQLLKKYSYVVLTLDLILPDENGIDLIQDLHNKKATQNLPIVVISAKADEGKSILKGYALGVVDWLSKPIDIKRLLRDIAKISDNSKRPVILHVEDDADLVHIIAMSISHVADVIPAGTIKEAEKHLSTKNIDLILLDISLPDGSGLGLLEKLNPLNPIPVIILSASEISDEISEKVNAALVKSKASEDIIVSTIKMFIPPNNPNNF